MKDFFKNKKVILTLILLLGIVLRLLYINKGFNIWGSEYRSFSLSIFQYRFDFFDAIKTNSYAPMHYFYLKLWHILFKNFPCVLKFSTLIPSAFACFVMYLVGKNYFTKNNSQNIGLVCAIISAVSSFLVCFAINDNIYSMTFLLASLVLLFSIKMYENPSKKNFIWLLVLSILLVTEHTLGFVFIIFNTFSLIAFKNKGKKKKDTDYFVVAVAFLILCLPIIPFIFRMFLHPTYFSQWWAPFNWSKIFFVFTDFFSPVLRNITLTPDSFYHQIILNDVINYGFLMFGLIPALICLCLLVKSNIESKKINKYFLSVLLTTFLTILIAAIAGKITFMTKYFVELYPILILMTAIGFCELNSKNIKITLATIYLFMSLFCLIYLLISGTRLI